MYNNQILATCILAWFIAQVIKIIINLYRVKKLDFKLLTSSGGMPSSHSSIVTCCSTLIGMRNGFDSDIFTLSVVLSLIVMYDAAGVRRAAGKQAAILNRLVIHIGDANIPIDKKLKELLGHSPLQVFFGALLGIVVAVISNSRLF